MNRFLELLFLKNLGLNNTIINKNYINIIKQSDNFDSFIKLLKQDEYIKNKNINFQENINNIKQKNNNFKKMNIKIITVFDEFYPDNLFVLGDKKPVILYVKGNYEILSQKNIAIIGTRNPTEWSKKVEQNLVKKILQISNVNIISGLALGCDKIAHETTVNIKKNTIAVLPSGVNNIVPSSNKELAKQIINTGGCLLSEYEPDMNVTKVTYIERDSIVAALSDVIIVIECNIKSGTMHTINFSNKLNKPLGSYYIEDKNKGIYEGNNFIIQNKIASKITNTKELISFLNKTVVKVNSNE